MASIDNVRSGQVVTTTNRSPGRTTDANNSATTKTESGTKPKAPQDSVFISKQSKALQDVAATPSFDSAKVAAIKEAIANGSYKVDAGKLADNIIKFGNEL